MSLTSLTRWEPFRDLFTMQDRMNRIFNDTLTRLPAGESFGAWAPPVDISEEGDNIVLRAEVPGVNKDDLDIKVENGTLTLRGEKKLEKEANAENAYRVERYYGAFSRSFVLPTAIDPDRIKATYRDGVLEVIVPKAEEAKPKKIRVLTS
ncbi:MAG TPA: Hsp20/alpha crystallin family protein [Candidatus Polarisedimenticolia bacterium]|nr:Hsp20/alpha crystallin family protein [Candidatus Polarisedimenticolia bacterium]